jgi:TonB-linked SusC/RagA family outer membrane protein
MYKNYTKKLGISRKDIRKILFIMRLTTFLLIVGIMQVSAASFAQKVTLAEKNASLKTLFKEIRKQTNYDFIYTDELLQTAKTVDINVKSADISDVLEQLFKDQPLTYTVTDKTVVIKQKEPTLLDKLKSIFTASSAGISGTVTDSLFNPLVGATVVLANTKYTAITDDEGKFTFSDVPNGKYQLLITYIGYQKFVFDLEVKGNNLAFPRLVLHAENDKLKEVVVSTGYQTLSEERATGSFTQIDNKTLNEQVGSNILDRLNGVTNGVLFSSNTSQEGLPTFTVRGLSTINGPNAPLIVVDNFPYDGDINNINPNDVESITVLKDAAASSIWGVRAANGVVVITTKKGRFNQALQIDFNSNISVTGKPDLSALRTINSSDYIDVEQYLFKQGFYDNFLSNTYNYPAVSPVVAILAQERAGQISASDATNQINAYRSVDERQQLSNYIYQKATTQQYALNIHGGSGNIAYYFSAGYDKGIDNLDTKNDRLTLRSENTYKPFKNLTLNIGVQYTTSNNNSGKQGYGLAAYEIGQWQIPYTKLADANGNPLPVAHTYSQAYIDTAGGGKLLNWNYYPLTDWQHNTSSITQQDLTANLGLNYRILKDLSADIKYEYERQTGTNQNLEDLQSYEAANLINTFTQINSSTGAVTYIVPLGDIYSLNNNIIQTNDVRGQLNYDHAWGKNKLDAIVGTEIRQLETTSNNFQLYGYDPTTLISANVDPVNAYPEYMNGSYGNIPYGSGLSEQLNRYVSYFGNAAYNFNDRYTISASGRRDASNLFGVSTNNKWNPLWSAGAAWNISNESFYKVNWLPSLKLRATYGFGGNTDPSRTAVTTLVYSDPGPPSNLPTERVNQFPNPDLKWETVRTINFGLDFQTTGQILTGSIETYFKKGTDLYGPYAVDPTDGLDGQSTITKNVANMSGKGVDISLNTKNIDMTFKWTTGFIFNYQNNKTTKYYNYGFGVTSAEIVGQGETIDPIVGQPLYSLVTFKWAGLDANGNPHGYLNGKISEDYLDIINNTPLNDLIYKPALPVYYGSISNTFTYKQFSLIANITYRLGYYFLKPTLNYSALFNGGAGIGSSDYANRWQKPGDETKTNVPSLIYPDDPNRDFFYNEAAINVDKADNIKLQFIRFSYDLAGRLSKNFPVKHLQLYMNISNLGLIWKANKDGLDPDYYSTTPPPAKTYALGLTANF